MDFSHQFAGQEDALVTLFRDTFTASEGEDEGRMIGKLAHGLLTGTRREDLHVFTAMQGETLKGCIIFSRLSFDADPRKVFVLGPVAVIPDSQRQGIGLSLLRHGLAQLPGHGVDIAITYGDPAYYGKVGFLPIRQEDISAPYPLQYPHGWLGQSLNGSPLVLSGPSRCVTALDDPHYW